MALTLACIGDNCIDRYLAPVRLATVGGNALNVAVGLARREHSVAYLGAVGADADGRSVVSAATSSGVDMSRVGVYEAETAVTLVELRPGGERVFVEERHGAGELYRPDDADMAFLDGCAWVHGAGLGERSDVLTRLDGARLSYDFSSAHDPALLERLAPLLEIAFLSGADLDRERALQIARDAVDAGAGSAVVTRGGEGSLGWNGKLVERTAEPVTVVDTLGAGDALIAAVIAARVRGSELGAALEAGSLAAAHACTHFGAWEAA